MGEETRICIELDEEIEKDLDYAVRVLGIDHKEALRRAIKTLAKAAAAIEAIRGRR